MRNNDVKRWQYILSFVGLLTFLMGGFQNCGEQPILEVDPNGGSGFVSIVHGAAPQKLSFMQPNLTVSHIAGKAKLKGNCELDSEGERIAWSLSSDYDNENLGYGDSFCDSGAFQVDIENLKELNCDESYKVHVENDSGHEDVMFITKVCD